MPKKRDTLWQNLNHEILARVVCREELHKILHIYIILSTPSKTCANMLGAKFDVRCRTQR